MTQKSAHGNRSITFSAQLVFAVVALAAALAAALTLQVGGESPTPSRPASI